MNNQNTENKNGINSSKVYCKLNNTATLIFSCNGINSSKVYCKS